MWSWPFRPFCAEAGMAPAISETAKTVKPATALQAVIFLGRDNFILFSSYL
jgi:hypothetical protein